MRVSHTTLIAGGTELSDLYPICPIVYANCWSLCYGPVYINF